MADSPIALNFKPGVQRDGTRVDGDGCVDAQWCRWRLGRPRKIGGYSRIVDNLGGPSRRIHMFYSGGKVYIHIGTSQGLQQVVIDQNGNFVSTANRTPSTFAAGPNVGWTLDAIFDTTSNIVQLVAHAAADLNATSSTTRTTPFIGQIDASSMLAAFPAPASAGGGTYTPPSVAGGVFCVQPYVFDFDINGLVQWSAPNLPADLGIVGGTSGAGQARISAQKIVAGMAARGGGANSPAALILSLSEVITATFVGGPPVWAFNTVSPSSSILSGDSLIEYDSIYYWAGIDRFMLYNGTVTEIPNSHNLDWFFDNMNWDFAGRSYAHKVPRFGEIWFCAPLFGNTEPSHAAIYNMREQCWYDTVLPNGGRSAGYFAQGLRFPVMGGSVRGANGFDLWLHENGTDELRGTTPTPIRSYFETPFLGGPKSTPPTDDAISFQGVEADHIQSGDMSVYVVGGANPRSSEYASDPIPLKAIASIPQDQIPQFKTERRYGRLHFESNVLGGNYIVGRSLLHAGKGDSKKLGGVDGKPLTEGA